MAELFLDRFEGDLAVLIYAGRQLRLPRALLPADAKEGEVLKLSLERDPEATKRAMSETQKLRDDLGKGDDGVDLKL